ncbi:hypothetical protein D9M72_227870 [compost metagenome]
MPNARTWVGYCSGAKIQIDVFSNTTQNVKAAPNSSTRPTLYVRKPKHNPAAQASPAPIVSTRLRGK